MNRNAFPQMEREYNEREARLDEIRENMRMTAATVPYHLLAYEIDGVLEDVRVAGGLDQVCIDTLERVRNILAAAPKAAAPEGYENVPMGPVGVGYIGDAAAPAPTPRTDDPDNGYRSHYAEHEHNKKLCRQLERENAALDDLCASRFDEIAKLQEQLAALRADAKRSTWQPIETAPKGKIVLVHYKNQLGKGRTMRARYCEPETLESETSDSGFADEGWYEESEAYEYLMPLDHEPSHWQPLPTPPIDAAMGDKNADE